MGVVTSSAIPCGAYFSVTYDRFWDRAKCYELMKWYLRHLSGLILCYWGSANYLSAHVANTVSYSKELIH